MADERDIVARLKYVLDEQSARRAEQSADKLEKSIKDIGKTADSAFSGKAVSATNDLTKALKAQAAQLDANTDKVKQYADRFDATSRNVALAGDVESNLRTVGGAAGAFGASGISSGVGAAAELPALIEALPRFKESLIGLPSTIAAAATSLGPVGLGLAGVALVAGGAFALASKELNALKQNAEEYAAAQAARAENEANVELLLLQGKRTEALQVLAQQEDELNLALLQSAKIRDDIARQEQVLADNALTFKRGQGTDLSLQEIQQTQANIDELKDTLKDLELNAANAGFRVDETAALLGVTDTSLGGIAAATAEVRTAVEDATKAEQERIQALQQQASLERQRVLTDAQLSSLSTDALAAREEQIRNEIEANQAAANVLKEAGEDATQYTSAIDELNRQLAYIEETARPAAQALEQVAERQKKLDEKQKEQAKQTEKLEQDKAKALDTYIQSQVNALKEQQQLANRQRAIFEKLADAREGAAKDYARALEDSDRDAGRERIDALTEFNREAVKAERDQSRELEKIRKDAAKRERDLARDRDFLGLLQERESSQDAIAEAEDNFANERQEAQIAYAERLTDLQTALERERQDLALNQDRKLQDIDANSKKELEAFQRAQQEKLALEQAQTQLELQLRRGKNEEALALETEFATRRNQLIQQSLAQVGVGSKGLQTGGYGASVPLPTRPVSGGSTYNTKNDNKIEVNVNGAGNPQDVARLVEDRIAYRLNRLTQ